jgi:cytoskeletal protein CcmA (bactofilin family)
MQVITLTITALLLVSNPGTGESVGQLPEIVIQAENPQRDVVTIPLIDIIGPVFAFAQTIPEPAEEQEKETIEEKTKLNLGKGDIIGEDYHVLKGDTVYDDITVGGGNAEIEGVIDGDLAVMGGIVKVSGTIDGDVAVFGGNLELTGMIDGDAAVMGGNIKNRGSISGDLFIVGGTVLLDSGSVVEGDISMVGGTVDRDENAVVLGEINSVELEVLHEIMPRIGKALRFPKFLPGQKTFPRIFFIAVLLVMYIINLLVFIIFPGFVEKIADRLSAGVWPSVGLGLALQILYVPLIVLFAVSVIGIPLIPIFALAVFLAAIFGVSALSLIIGGKVTEGFKWKINNRAGLLSIGWITLMIIPLIVHIIGAPIFILGWIIIYVVITIGIGAVIYTFIKKSPATVKK